MVRILVADDHPVLRHGVRSLLEQRTDWQICAETGDGREAVQLVKTLKPDLAVLDLLMPGLNGLEATRLIRREAPETEVLVFTMHTAEDLVQQVVSAGARGFLFKSDAPEDLITAVETVSRHAPYFTPRISATVIERMAHSRNTVTGVASMLTSREREIVQLIAEGLRTRAIAQRLGISEKTVETHRSAVMKKLCLDSLADVVRYAIRNRLVEA